MAITMIITLCLPAKARANVSTPSSGTYYRISYEKNGRYLDIPSEGYSVNGTQLQLWDYVYGNQNQVFMLRDTGNGWQIVAQNGKIVEVADSRHDDRAPVQQWSSHSLNCALWNIRTNSNGTVSFQNKESLKWLNVCGGGDAGNGTKIIQYKDDKSVAMRFHLEALNNDADVFSAYFERTLDNSELAWTPNSRDVLNCTMLNGKKLYKYDGKSGWYPSVGQEFFYSADFLSPYAVGNMLKTKDQDSSLWTEIKKAVRGELSSDAITALSSKIGLKLPKVGFILSVFEILLDCKEKDNWNKFTNAIEISKDGHCSGVIVYTFYKVIDLPVLNGYEIVHFVDLSPRRVYKKWTGDNFGQVNNVADNAVEGVCLYIKNGTWQYSYK